MIATMDATRGRVGVVVPHGVLFRGGAEGRIRRSLIEENLLDAVVGLPPNLFYGTGIPAAILIFRRDRADDRVLFIDASREFEQGTNQNVLRQGDLERMVAAYRRRENVERYAAVATCEEIASNDFNLNIPRYVDTFEEEEAIDLPALNHDIARLESDLDAVQISIAGYLKELGL